MLVSACTAPSFSILHFSMEKNYLLCLWLWFLFSEESWISCRIYCPTEISKGDVASDTDKEGLQEPFCCAAGPRSPARAAAEMEGVGKLAGLGKLTEMGKCSRTQQAPQGEFQCLGRGHCPCNQSWSFLGKRQSTRGKQFLGLIHGITLT